MEREPAAGVAAELVAEHDQRTFELTERSWTRRDRPFLVWLLAVAAAALLSGDVTHAQPLLLDWLVSALDMKEPARIDRLREGFPFALLHAALLLVVFYLTVNVHHAASNVLRGYRYLGLLEGELRRMLRLERGSSAFTREGAFYSAHRARLQPWVQWAYEGIMATVLLLFLGARVIDDARAGAGWMLALDALIGAPTLLFFGAYALPDPQPGAHDREAVQHEGAET